MVSKGEGVGEGRTGSLGLVKETITLRMDKQQSPVQHRKLYPVSWD